jgi:hypothetical protein
MFSNPETPLKKRHSPHQTQWAAQFAVASELCKRDYQVALTMGNHPRVDLMVISPRGTKFAVDVKGLYKRNWWLITEKEALQNLFYVLAFVPVNAPNQFFILKQQQVNEAIPSFVERGRQERLRKGRSIEKVEQMRGLPWTFVERFTDWGILPK